MEKLERPKKNYREQLREALEALPAGGFVEIDEADKNYTSQVIYRLNLERTIYKTEYCKADPAAEKRFFVVKTA